MTVKSFKHSAVVVIGFVSWLLGRLRHRRRPVDHTAEVLRELARHTSRTVAEVAARLQLPLETATAIVTDLEQQGLARVSPDRPGGHVRIAAITGRGREAANKLAA